MEGSHILNFYEILDGRREMSVVELKSNNEMLDFFDG